RVAVDKPIPENVGQTPYPDNPLDLPTVISTRQAPLPAGKAPSAPAPSSPGIGGFAFPSTPTSSAISGSGEQAALQTVGSSQPYPAVPPRGPITPISPPSFTPSYAAQSSPAGASLQPPPAPPSKKPRRRGLWIVLAALLILALVGSGLGAYFAFFSNGTTATAPQIVGHAYFVSSGLLSPD